MTVICYVTPGNLFSRRRAFAGAVWGQRPRNVETEYATGRLTIDGLCCLSYANAPREDKPPSSLRNFTMRKGLHGEALQPLGNPVDGQSGRLSSSQSPMGYA